MKAAVYSPRARSPRASEASASSTVEVSELRGGEGTRVSIPSPARANRPASLAARVGRHLDVVPGVRTAAAFALLSMCLACGGGDDDGGGADAAPGAPDAAGDLPPATAVPGARCGLADLVGVVQISTGKIARADLYDRVDPFIGEPALEDDHCAFHEFAPAEQCPPCSVPEVCSIEGMCVDAPRRDTGGTLIVRAGDDAQSFEADGVTGELGGAITLPGTSFAVEVEFFGQRVTLEEELAPPDLLPGFSAVLVGTYDAPEAVEAEWDPVAAGSHLFTRVPINHHAAAPTFTDCAIGGDAGALTIPGEMLEPLAVSTGLEFQGFDHIRFAAAETARGCVEVRFTSTQSVGLDSI